MSSSLTGPTNSDEFEQRTCRMLNSRKDNRRELLTKIVLKQDQAASQVLKEAFNLSDGEEKFIVNAKIGQGILVTQKGRIPFYNLLSDEEKRPFTTKPKDVTA